MKYTLVVGIEYKKYKKSANIRISTDERLIDDFDLDKDIKSFEDADQVLDNINKFHYKNLQYRQMAWDSGKLPSRKVIRGTPMDRVYQGPMDPQFVDTRWPSDTVPRYFRVYDIDDTHLKNILKLTVSNSNSDYSNGFIKNSSLIRFPIIALFPKELTENNCEKLMKILVKFENNTHDRHWYKQQKSHTEVVRYNVCTLGYNKQGSLECAWPSPEYYKITFNDNNNADGIKQIDEWLGGSFDLELQIKKKHRVSFLCPEGMNTTGMWRNLKKQQAYAVASCKQLLNIYNEDQRDNHTQKTR